MPSKETKEDLGIDGRDEPRSDQLTQKQSHFRRYNLGFSLSNFGIGPAFGAFVTYVSFQMQSVAFAIGYELGAPAGTGCPPTAISCLVPFGNSGNINITSFLLYLNAIAYAVSGALTLVVSGIGDQMAYQREQYVFMLVLYGILCLPAAALKANNLSTLNAFAGLYVVFNTVGFLAQAWMNIFIPFIMQKASNSPSTEHQQVRETIRIPNEGHIGVIEQNNMDTERNGSDAAVDRSRTREQTGLAMSVWGSNGMNAGLLVLYLIVIGLTHVSTLYAGLYMTTTSGVLCILLSLISWPLLPTPPRKANEARSAWLWISTPVRTIKILVQDARTHPDTFKYLLAYAIYNDTVFAFGSVTSQLFQLNIRPSVREFSVYSLLPSVVSMVFATSFLYSYETCQVRFHMSLRHWSAVCYGIVTFCAVWCCIGISPTARIGLKHRWEFYFLQVLQSIAGSVVSVSFRVLFSQMFPIGEEVQYFGFQLVLSCSTVWIPQIVNAPIVSATNNIRLPAVISAVFFLLSLALTLWTNEAKGRQHRKR